MDAYAPTDRLLAETFHCPGQAIRRRRRARARTRPQAGPGRRLVLPRRRPPPPRQADEVVAAPCSKRPGRADSASTAAFEAFDAARRPGAIAADTEQGAIAADAFVVAAGAWTPLLNDQLGCKIPIQPGKGYSLTMPRPAICPSIPLIFPETRVAVTPFQSGYRLGSTMEFAGYDDVHPPRAAPAPPRRRRAVPPRARLRRVEQTWFGWRPMTWDSLPIIDRTPALRQRPRSPPATTCSASPWPPPPASSLPR